MKWHIFTLSLLLCNSVCSASNIANEEVNSFAAKTGALTSFDKATNSLSFLRFPVSRFLQLTGITPEEKANFFLKKIYPPTKKAPESWGFVIHKLIIFLFFRTISPILSKRLIPAAKAVRLSN